MKVGELRKIIKDLSDDVEITVSIDTDYDGSPTTREGPAFSATVYNGERKWNETDGDYYLQVLEISGSDGSH